MTLGFADVQPGHHVLYVSLFALGIVARRSAWIDRLGPEPVGTWLLSGLGLHPLLAFALLCAFGVTATYAFSDLLRRLPGVRQVV